MNIFKKALSRLALFSALIVVSVAWNTASAQAPNASVSGTLSRNWSGYAASGNTYTSVTGTWTVPSVSSSLPVAADAAWVGIGGLSDSDLIQAGTQEIIQNGTVQYQAWYETLPNASTPISLPVHPGDSITVTINELGTNQWFVFIANNTTGQNYSTVLDYTSAHNSVEWIQEMPSDQNGYIPLDNFGTVSFTNAHTIVNGQLESLAQANAHALAMISGDSVIAEPSSIGSDGASFSVTRTNQAVNAVPQVVQIQRGAWRVGRVAQIRQPVKRTIYIPGIGTVTEVTQSFSSGDGSMKGYSYSISF